MKKPTKKQQAAIDARNAAKVLEVETTTGGTCQSIYRVYSPTAERPEGRREFLAEIAPNYAGKGKPFCVYVPEPDPKFAWEGNGLTFGFFAESREAALSSIRNAHSH